MKKIFNIIGGIAVAATVFTSCERDISTLNSDPKHPEAIPSQSLLNSAEQVLFDQMVTPSVNNNIARFFTQQWTETSYIDETNYNFVTRNQPQNHWNTFYRRILQPLNVAAKQLPSEQEAAGLTAAQIAKVKANKKAVIEIISTFAWKNLVETYGNVPYTEALQNETGAEILQPKYDDAATVYSSVLTRLNTAIASIDTSAGGYNDIIYKGDMSKWKKLGNSIKLEMGLMLSDVNPNLAKTTVESAAAGGVITSVADDFAIQYETGQFSNPIYQNLVASGRNDFIPSDVYVNNLKAKKDPRRFQFFAENRNLTLGTVSGVATTGSATVITFAAAIPAASTPTVGAAIFKDVPSTASDVVANEDDLLLGYVTAISGNSITLESPRATVAAGDVVNMERYTGGPYGNLASYASYTHVNTSQKFPTAKGLVVDQVEVKFQLAEAAARGFNVGGTVEALYNNAVLASMAQWGVNSGDAAAYLAAHPYDAANWKKSIGEEAWVAMYNRGFEAWNFWRRLDAPSFTKPGNADGLVYRMPYSFNEYSTNKANVTAAGTAIGSDKYITKLFFDKF